MPAAAELLDEFVSNIQNIIASNIQGLSEEETQALTDATRTIIKIINIDGGLYNEARA